MLLQREGRQRQGNPQELLGQEDRHLRLSFDHFHTHSDMHTDTHAYMHACMRKKFKSTNFWKEENNMFQGSLSAQSNKLIKRYVK